jgi:hypothetical protein
MYSPSVTNLISLWGYTTIKFKFPLCTATCKIHFLLPHLWAQMYFWAYASSLSSMNTVLEFRQFKVRVCVCVPTCFVWWREAVKCSAMVGRKVTAISGTRWVKGGDELVVWKAGGMCVGKRFGQVVLVGGSGTWPQSEGRRFMKCLPLA